MVERTFSCFQNYRNRLERLPLFVRKNRKNCVHVACQTGYRQIGPEMAAGDVVDAAILLIRIIEANPAGNVREGLSARPVGIILMPCHDTTVMCWLGKDLVVPE